MDKAVVIFMVVVFSIVLIAKAVIILIGSHFEPASVSFNWWEHEPELELELCS